MYTCIVIIFVMYLALLLVSLYIMIPKAWCRLIGLRIILSYVNARIIAFAYRTIVYFNCWHWLRAEAC